MSLMDDLDDDDLQERKPIPVKDLPYYETLREILEPYRPAAGEQDADMMYTSVEIIKAIELHHGVPQGPDRFGIREYVKAGDFVRAMRHCGFTAVNGGRLGLRWVMKKK